MNLNQPQLNINEKGVDVRANDADSELKIFETEPRGMTGDRAAVRYFRIDKVHGAGLALEYDTF